MSAQTPTTSVWIAGIFMSVLGIATACFDYVGMLTSVRLVLHDVVSPGRLILLSMKLAAPQDAASAVAEQTGADDHKNIHQLRSALAEGERQRRQLIIENAVLRNDLARQISISRAESLLSPFGGSPSGRLAAFDVIPADVISRNGLPDRLRQDIINAGSASGITRSELVVDGEGLLLSEGSDQQIQTGARVLAGSIVAGKILKTAKWVSLLQPVTDKEFSARVQLLRSSTQGVHFGSEGILKGTGNGDCVIEGISYTDAVSVGDEVVTAEIDGLKGPRLYFGRVTRADFTDGGHWQISVQPAISIQQLNRVGIVRSVLKPPKTSAAGRTAERQGNQETRQP